MHTRFTLSLLLIGACAAPAELSSLDQAVTSCAPAVCGFNSPEIDRNGIHELQKFGEENADGFAITGFVKAGLAYRLEVTNGELSGTRRGSPAIAHQDLVGAQILVRRYNRDAYAIRVAAVGTMPFYVPPAGAVETYVLEYSRYSEYQSADNWQNVCGGIWLPPEEVVSGPNDTHPLINVETFGQPPGESILFDLDRVDLTTKTLNARPDTRWFNIGCAGHTLSKLYLTHNMIASQGAAYGNLWAERQATLKMLVADYCGDGTPFTVAGQRLDWQGGGMSYFTPPLALEARWTERGAMCLDTPRMTHPSTDEGAVAFPDVETAITDHCARPRPCDDSDPMSMRDSLRVSSLR